MDEEKRESDLDEPTLRLQSREDSSHYSRLYSDTYIPPCYCLVNFGAIKKYTFRNSRQCFLGHGGNMRSSANRAVSSQDNLHHDLPRAPLCLFGVIKTLSTAVSSPKYVRDAPSQHLGQLSLV
jgi:hypothetical protein